MNDEVQKEMIPERGRKKKEDRPQRKSLEDMQSRLEIIGGQDKNYVYKWVFDDSEGGFRIMKHTELGFEFADARKHSVASAHTFDTSEYGSVIRKSDGKNGGYNFLMRIRREWWDENQQFRDKRAKDAVSDIYKTEDEDVAEGGDGIYSRGIKVEY